ncbi:MAG TPA: hypothetical protein VJ343_01115 [archaeon]|nr:hypothetical protein [archaeon]
MDIEFLPGFITYDFGPKRLLFAVLHSTTSLKYTPRGDVGADLLAVHLAMDIGCKAVISTTPREEEFGIDFNRLPPPKSLALNMFDVFEKNENKEKILWYFKKYSWVATTTEDYADKLKVYKSFWSYVGKLSNSKSPIVFVHMQDPVLRNFPSLIDVISLGIEKRRIEEAIAKLNKKYRKTFGNMKKDFADFSASHAKYYYKNSILQAAGTLNPKGFSGKTREDHEKMLKRVDDLGFNKIYRELKNSFTFEKYLRAVKYIEERVPLKVTSSLNFSGKYALGTKKFLRDFHRKGIELEVNGFLSEVRTDLGIEIIKDFLQFTGLSI